MEQVVFELSILLPGAKANSGTFHFSYHEYAEIAYAESEPSPKNKVEVKRCPITSKMVIDREDIDGDPNGFAIHINDGEHLYYILVKIFIIMVSILIFLMFSCRKIARMVSSCRFLT